MAKAKKQTDEQAQRREVLDQGAPQDTDATKGTALYEAPLHEEGQSSRQRDEVRTQERHENPGNESVGLELTEAEAGQVANALTSRDFLTPSEYELWQKLEDAGILALSPRDFAAAEADAKARREADEQTAAIDQRSRDAEAAERGDDVAVQREDRTETQNR